MIRRAMSSERARQQEESGVAARGVSPQLSSASGLSSPPRSSPEPGSPSAQFASGANSSSIANQNSSITVNPPPGVVQLSAEKPARRKPGRKPGSHNKPKNAADSSATNTGLDAPKVRRPRKPKDPNAPPAKRQRKNASLEANSVVVGEAVAGLSRQSQAGPEHLASISGPAPVAAQLAQTGNNEDIQQTRPVQSFFNNPPPPPPQQSQPQQPLRTSGQNYDPIRSNYDPVRETVVSHNSYNNSQGSPGHPHSVNRASASPSISSLVDPPNQALTSPSIAAQSFFHQQQQQQARFHHEGHTSVPPSPTVNRLAPSATVESSNQKAPAMVTMAVRKHDLAPAPGPSTISKKALGTGSTATSSAAASPKPHKPKEAKEKDLYPTPPPLPGSSLMQLGGAGGDAEDFRAPTVILQIPLNGEVNKYVNFTRLAEERYGWDALHPRLAAQRDRLARVAAAGAALERNGSNNDSGEEMSVDSGDDGSNIEMGGMTGTDDGKKIVPKKRMMKEDQYDKNDGFVDDSELLWEEQAAAANDGFFVYSGPLVPEIEKPVEPRGDGPPKRGRGRGRGGARASGGRGGAAALHAAVTGLRPNGLPISGPGSRGGSTTRKPRITKADRARMEQEKLEREKMGMSQMPGPYSSMAQLASAPNMGNTPMVFNQ